MPSWPALGFLILVVSIPSRHAGTAVHPERRNHDQTIRLFHFFVVPGEASTGEALPNRPRTTSITGVPKLSGLS